VVVADANSKILRSVICPITIDMVDLFISFKFPANDFRHNNTMFKRISKITMFIFPRVVLDLDVTLVIYDSTPFPIRMGGTSSFSKDMK